MSSDEPDDWSDVREWLKNGTTPLPPSVLRHLLAERDALKVEVADLWTELELCRKMCRRETLNRQVKNKPARPYSYDSTGIDFTPGATDAD